MALTVQRAKPDPFRSYGVLFDLARHLHQVRGMKSNALLAVKEGQVVLVQGASGPPVVPTLRDRDETTLAAALCMAFKLGSNESRMLAQLVTHDCCSVEELRAATAQVITPDSAY